MDKLYEETKVCRILQKHEDKLGWACLKIKRTNRTNNRLETKH